MCEYVERLCNENIYPLNESTNRVIIQTTRNSRDSLQSAGTGGYRNGTAMKNGPSLCCDRTLIHGSTVQQ